MKTIMLIGVLLATACVCGLLFLQTESPETVQTEVQFSLQPEQLQQLSWEDLPQAISLSSGSSLRQSQLVEHIGPGSSDAAHYLKALLRLAQGHAAEADRLFAEIPLDQIPVSMLYAPFRVREGGDAKENPYLLPLITAGEEGKLPKLVHARLLVRAGVLEQALQKYAMTDPSRWAQYDLASFEIFLRHDGLSDDAMTFANAVIAGGRMESTLASSLKDVLVAPPVPPSSEMLESDLGQATMADINALRLRFVRQEYAAITAAFKSRAANTVSDETNLLVFVSAVASAESVEADKWGQELKRRFPDKETEQWIVNLRKTS
ncbi:MAG: hypothetical protein ACI9SB_000943 [Candidatus Azotimanducaceae bacterium]|jgi:hypothetical protein